ncbi:MAG: SDR family NAD(P)-dependent oxidoreductase [Anaerolineales bacterium]
MTQTLKGKVVLITGASSGFGEDAALLFAREGAVVALAARRVERLQALAEKIRAEGGEALVIPTDVSSSADIQHMVKSVIEHYQRIDILFNNAGFGRLGRLEDLDPADDIRAQIAVNLTGLIEVTHAVLPHMLAKRSGHILNMSSVAGWVGAPRYSVYTATKFGARGFTDALRREVGLFGIKVTGIYPGPADTEFGQHTGNHAPKANAPSRAKMTSEYVARKVVEAAKHPRRTVVLPWWYHLAFWLNFVAPGVVDWILGAAFARRYRHQ